MIEFDLPKEKSSIIKVFGIGGGGSNAVNYMYKLGIEGVNYVICNTDNQALEMSDVPNKVQLGSSLREGLGAGSKPEVGREATEEAIDQLEEILQTNTKMAFITAGMGGGTGTGGAPVVARLAKDMGILTVAIVTTPFVFEGKKRLMQAEAGIAELKDEVDALLVISNDKLREIHGNLRMSEAFAKADDILSIASKGIAEIITKIGYVNVDFEDVNTVMRDSGVALMGIGLAGGESRAVHAVEEALQSPLLNDNNIVGAKSILLNLSYGSDEITMDEMGEITDYIQEAIGVDAENLIFGYSEDESLDDEIRVTLIATGFESNEQRKEKVKNAKVIHTLENKSSQAAPVPTTAQAEADQVEVDESMPYLKTELADDSSAKQITFDFSDEEQTASRPTMEFKPLNQCNEDQSQQEAEEIEAEVEEVQPTSNASPVTRVFTLRDEEQTPEPQQPLLEQPKQEEFRTQVEDSSQEILQNTQDERIQRLKSFNLRVKTVEDVEELENQPAYLRKNVELDNVPNAKEQNISRFSLSESEEGEGAELRKNSFLHDNVD